MTNTATMQGRKNEMPPCVGVNEGENFTTNNSMESKSWPEDPVIQQISVFTWMTKAFTYLMSFEIFIIEKEKTKRHHHQTFHSNYADHDAAAA